MFQNIGALELIVIGIVVLVLFGGKKLPELAHGIAESIKEFRKAFKADDNKKEESE